MNISVTLPLFTCASASEPNTCITVSYYTAMKCLTFGKSSASFGKDEPDFIENTVVTNPWELPIPSYQEMLKMNKLFCRGCVYFYSTASAPAFGFCSQSCSLFPIIKGNLIRILCLKSLEEKGAEITDYLSIKCEDGEADLFSDLFSPETSEALMLSGIASSVTITQATLAIFLGTGHDDQIVNSVIDPDNYFRVAVFASNVILPDVADWLASRLKTSEEKLRWVLSFLASKQDGQIRDISKRLATEIVTNPPYQGLEYDMYIASLNDIIILSGAEPPSVQFFSSALKMKQDENQRISADFEQMKEENRIMKATTAEAERKMKQLEKDLTEMRQFMNQHKEKTQAANLLGATSTSPSSVQKKAAASSSSSSSPPPPKRSHEEESQSVPKQKKVKKVTDEEDDSVLGKDTNSFLLHRGDGGF